MLHERLYLPRWGSLCLALVVLFGLLLAPPAPALAAENENFGTGAFDTNIDLFDNLPAVDYTETAGNIYVQDYSIYVPPMTGRQLLGTNAGATLTITFLPVQLNYQFDYALNTPAGYTNAFLRVQRYLGAVLQGTDNYGGFTQPANLPNGTPSVGFASSTGAPFDRLVITADTLAFVLDNIVTTDAVIQTQTGGTTAIAEGGATDTYSFVLGTLPSVNVTITLTPDADCTVNPATLTFTPGNWNTAQNVIVTAVDDAIAEGAHTCTIAHTIAGGEYAAVPIPDVVATVTDNDTAAVTVAPTTVAVTETTPAAGVNYTVVLDRAPTADVVINIAPTSTQCAVNPTALTFTTANWNTAQTVTVTADDDLIIEGNHTCTINHTIAAGSAAEYVPVTVAAVTVNITDNDTPSVIIGSLPVTAAEGGGTGDYTLVLSLLPTGNVTINIAPNAQCTINPASLTFTTGNWNTPQTVVVTAVDDTVVEGPHTCTITHTIAAVSAAEYLTVTVAAVTAAITDNDSSIATPSGGSGGSSGASGTVGVGTPVPPSVPLCADVGGSTNPIVRAVVMADTVARGNVYCRVIAQNGIYIRNASEVGNDVVFSQGVIQAVDVFGLRSAGESERFFAYNVKVCLLGLGGLMYLDATTAPRVPEWLTTSSEGMYTCGLIPRAGTVVLVGGYAPALALAPLQELTDCRIESNVNGLRFRKSPDTTSQIIGLLVTGDTYPANARQGDWFRVRAQSADGWVNAAYVTASGNCGN